MKVRHLKRHKPMIMYRSVSGYCMREWLRSRLDSGEDSTYTRRARRLLRYMGLWK